MRAQLLAKAKAAGVNIPFWYPPFRLRGLLSGGQTLTGPPPPVLTRTSAAGINPMAWTSSITGAMVDVDNIRCRWRVNGGAWTYETDHLFTSDDAFDAIDGTLSFVWPLFDAYNFPASALVEVQEAIARPGYSDSWSTILSDTMAGTNPVLYTHGGQASSAASATSQSFTNLPFTSTDAIVAITCFSTAGGTTSSVPTSVTLTPSAGGSAVNLTLIGSGGRAASRGFAVYRGTLAAAANHNLQITRPAAAEANVVMYGSLTGADPVLAAALTFNSVSSENNPHLTVSQTVPQYGLQLGWIMKESTGAGSVNSPGTMTGDLNVTSPSSNTCGLVGGQRSNAAAGTISFNVGTAQATLGRAAMTLKALGT